MNTLLDDNILLIDKEKQELIDIILKQREKIKELQSQNDELKAEKSKTFAPVKGPFKKALEEAGCSRTRWRNPSQARAHRPRGIFGTKDLP